MLRQLSSILHFLWHCSVLL